MFQHYVKLIYMRLPWVPSLTSTLASLVIILAGAMVPAIAATEVRPSDGELWGLELIAQEAIAETALFFETDNFAVRIYRRGQDRFMNLYNKRTGITEVRDTPAQLIPEPGDAIAYYNLLGEVIRYARVNAAGESELEIVNPADNTTLIKERGYNTVVGVPNNSDGFMGNNFAPGTAATVTVPRYAELRLQPQPTADMIITIPRGELVDVLDRVGNLADGYIWYQVLYNGTTGWVRGDTLTPA
jgi:hypothetical protein